MPDNFEKIIEKIIFIVLKGLIFIMPLFFLPWTASKLGIDNYNKWNLLIIFIPLAVFIYVINFILKDEVKIKISKLDLPIIIFLTVSFIAAIFSIDRFSSFFGADNISQPFFALLVLAFGYFLIKNFINFENIYGLLKIVLTSFFIVLISAFLILAGLRFGLIKDGNFIVNYFNSAVGTLEDLSLYISIISILIVSIINAKNKLFFSKPWELICLKIIFILSFIFLTIINFSPAWVCLLVGSLALYFANLFIFKRSAILPAILLFLSVAFIFLNFLSAKDSTDNRMASKLQLDFENTMKVSAESFKNRPLLGYGQENFSYVFSKYRSADLNNSAYWYLRYNNTYSYITSLISQTGILGLLSYFLFIYFILIYIIRLYKQTKKAEADAGDFSTNIVFGLSAAILALIVGQFFYSYNANLWWLFWLFLAFLTIAISKIFPETEREILITKKNKPRNFQIFIIVAFLLFSGWFALISLSAKYWIAEAKSRREKDEGALITAVRLNSNRYNYQINLSKFYLEMVVEDLNKPGAKIDMKIIENNIGKSVTYAKSAVAVAPNSVSAYETLGMIYSQMDKYAQDASGAAAYAYNLATRLEPTNPVLAGELGKAYLANGQNDLAISSLKKSVELKPDYYDGNLFLAKAYEQENKFEEALKILKGLLETSDDPEINYEIGRVYFNENKYDLAILEFQKVTAQVPNHANALYSLALSYESLQDKKSALYYFKKVLALNPGNVEINKKIGELEK